MNTSLHDNVVLRKDKRTRRPWTLAALMMAMFMGAIEATIVSTAIPTIVGDLGGFSLLTWVFSAYLLTQAATVPIYGKLADLYGRKPVFMVGAAIFVVGSLLCGLSNSMVYLVISRAIQGLGAGAVMPITSTIVGDLYELEERARIQGYLASVWGISSVLGPTMGGFIVTYWGWPWIFFINLPVATVAMVLLAVNFYEDIERKRHQIDYLGAGLIFATVGALITFLVQGGVAWPWVSPISIVLAITVVVGFTFFFVQESRAMDPILPLGLFKRRVILVGNLGAFLAGTLTLGMSSFIPTFVQGALGQTAIIAGLSIGAMSIGWPLSSSYAGRLMIRIGFRKTAIIGSAFNLAGAAVLVALSLQSTAWHVALGSFLMGVGQGLTTTTYLISIQQSVPWRERGVATGTNMFGRTLGSTLGVAVLGGLLNGRLAAFVREHGSETIRRMGADAGNALLDPVSRAALSPTEVEVLRMGLVSATKAVFWALLVVAVLVITVARSLPEGQQEGRQDSKSVT